LLLLLLLLAYYHYHYHLYLYIIIIILFIYFLLSYSLLSLIFEIFDLMFSDWVSFLAYPNLFVIKGFIVVLVLFCYFAVLVSGMNFNKNRCCSIFSDKNRRLLVCYLFSGYGFYTATWY
jgi:hypothetical protein